MVGQLDGPRGAGWLVAMVAVVSSAGAGAGAWAWAVSGDEADGSRAPYVHVIPLYPEDKDGQKGIRIVPDGDRPLPFSLRWSCSNCHDYELIRKGFHFNSTDPNVQPGRPAQPWLYADPRLAVQIPLSYRPWPGMYRPEQFGINRFDFIRRFGDRKSVV